ncbi:MAG: fumarylacetoacetate hydrolase family protein [Gammaproteobacteria bacterium]|nr:fumarylacetoacetate hydrolase family protein [Gammaproteobacteria bacterium]
MKWLSFRSDGVAGYGLLTDEGVRPVGPLFAARYPDLRAALAADVLAEAAAAARSNPWVRPLTSVEPEPPIPLPGKILCVGINYLAHMREMGHERPAYPTLFVRFPDTLVGDRGHIQAPRVSGQYDYEGELAVIIGRRAHEVAAADALSYIAGYSILMDGSVRDYQRHTSQFTSGKNFPRSGAFGPCMVTADEIPDPSSLRIETRLNAKVMQQAPIADMCFDVPALVSYISTVMLLEPGDVISTGTPSGVGFARKPPVFLRPGDSLDVEIPGIGVLHNTVVGG